MYQENIWADRFALPDVPITSCDSRRIAKQKLYSTRRQYKSFPTGFPEILRPKFLPVVHGTTSREVIRNARAARSVGSKSLGFGGFSTSGPNSGVNSFTPQNLRLLVQFAALCTQWGLDSHVFGIGGPAAIAVLNYVPINTLDSAGWIRTAAYGNVYLPYVGAVNITGAASSRRFVTRREFSRLRNATDHACPYCADHSLLSRSWPHRALHNYCTVTQTTRALDKSVVHHTLEKLQRFNPRFAAYLAVVLAERARLLESRANREIEGAS
jgi:queuine/archaeosine tRNA-ribosyltransferase